MGKKVVKIVTRIESVSQKLKPHEVPSVRVCAYCRVSTDGADQKNSFESQVDYLLGLDSDTFYIYHVTAVMVDNLRRLLLGINLSDKAVMDFDFPGVGFPV